MEKILFSENQTTKSIWVWLLLFFLLAIFLYATVVQVFLGQPFGSHATPDYVLIVTGILIIVFFWMVTNMRLITEVREDGWYYKFKPFHSEWRIIKWKDIETAEIKGYKPINVGKGKTFSIQGNKGLQLILKNKQRVLFGTQKPAELAKAIETVMNI